MRIAVFRTGRHTDSKGNKKEWTEGDLDEIVAKYDPAAHEAPVVIGHPKDNAPAYGWVERLQRVGDTLWAEIKPTVAEFADWLKAGLFKKRSISLYPDLSLRHIGFLGATPPAVKGLPDYAFNDPETAVIEFSSDVIPAVGKDSGQAGMTNEEFADAAGMAAHMARAKKHGIGMKAGGNRTKPSRYKDIPDDEFADPVNYRYPLDEEHIHAALAYWANPHNREQYSSEEVKKITARILAAAKKHGVEVDESKWKFSERRSAMSLWEEFKAFLKGKGVDVDVDDGPQSFSGDQVKAAAAAAVAKAKADMDASFAEKERQLKAREADLERRALEGRKKEVEDFCESLKKRGVLTPAMEKMGMGITCFLQAVAGLDTTYEFAEPGGDGKKGKETPLEFAQAFLAHLPKAIEFRELAQDKDDPGGGNFEEKRERAITEYMEHNKDADYKTAFLAVSKKHPELFELERR
ncbi:MAG: hypothetical protein M0Z48_00575 [Nitrospiraceae bacterium]|nr:hypothetical protein [Nitrospiraceae bacterium]